MLDSLYFRHQTIQICLVVLIFVCVFARTHRVSGGYWNISNVEVLVADVFLSFTYCLVFFFKKK